MLTDLIIGFFTGLVGLVIGILPTSTIDMSWADQPFESISGFMAQANFFFPVWFLSVFAIAYFAILNVKFWLRIITKIMGREIS